MKISSYQYTQYLLCVCFCVLSFPLPVLCQVMAYKSTEVIQITEPVFQGQQGARILKVEIVTKGSTTPINVQGLHFNTRGTTRVADLSNARVFYSGTKDITNIQTPASAVELGSVIKKPLGKMSFNFKQKLAEGTNYFYLTYDIGSMAQSGNLIDASLDSLKVNDTMIYPIVKSPVGSRKVENFATFCRMLVNTPNTTQQKLIGITNVKIGAKINNATADDDAVTFYPTPRVTTYRLEQLPVEIKAGSGHDEQIAAWADWNNDGFLDKNSEEIFYIKRLVAGETYKTNILIPCSATTGIHKIRIASDFYKEQKPEPCHNLIYGEAEEYLIEVLEKDTVFVSFSADTPAYLSSRIYFKNTSAAYGKVKYEWDYNDDGVFDETTINGSYIFNTSGKKTISLRLTQTTCTDTFIYIYKDTVNVIYPDTNTSSDFISSTNFVAIHEPVYLTDLSSGNPNYWKWKITPELVNGQAAYIYINNTDSSSQNPAVIFKESAIFTVSLITANANGNQSTEVKTNYISTTGNITLCNTSKTDTARQQQGFVYDNGGPNRIYTNSQKCFAVIKPPCAQSIKLSFNTFDVSAYMSTGGGDYLRVYDGTNNKGTALHDSAGFSNGFQNKLPGNVAFLPPTVTAHSGAMYLEWNSDSAFIGNGFEAQWQTILQNIPKPKASFNSPDTVYEMQNISFINISEGSNLKYFWDFNADGETDSVTANANYSFTTAGTYKVQLVVSNCGGTDTFTKNITVLTPAALPVADFKSGFTAYREGDVVAFTNLSTNNPYHYYWVVTPNVAFNEYEFVNGTSENSANPEIKFYNAGVYSIRLEVKNSLGSDGITKPNYIAVSTQCSPESKTISSDIGITSVSVTNISGEPIIHQTSSSGVVAYTLFSYKEPVLLETGATYQAEIKRPTKFNKIKGSIWIDLNDNGFFNDPGELVYKSDTITGDTWGGKFTVPGAINPGISRLRVGVTYISNSLVTCGNNIIAEFEDYTIVLSADKTKPVIKLLGQPTTYIEEGATYSDAGAEAFDNVDGNLTGKIVSSGIVNTSITGVYQIQFEVSDKAGNKTVAWRNVIVFADTTPPKIGIFGGDSVYVEVYNRYIEQGALTYDNVMPQPMLITSGKVDTAKLGIYKITYTATDSRGNKTIAVRRVFVGDTTPPKIIFAGGDTVKWQIYKPYKDSGVTVKDNYWPEVSLTRKYVIDENKAGLYKITYTSKDPSGNSTVRIRFVRIGDFIPPVITLPYDTFILDVHHPFKDPSVRMTDNFYPSSQLKMVRQGFVMENKVGTNILKYFARDPAGNLSAPKTLVVLVKDREAPKITLIGETVINLKQWQKFYEEGYIVTDNYDTFSRIEISGTFENANIPGTYARIYRARDKSGNLSEYAMRIIYVEKSTSSMNETAGGNPLNPVKIFPNPANSNIHISAEGLERTTVANIFLTDAFGRVVKHIWQGRYNGSTITSDVSGLAAGIYFIHMEAENQRFTNKLVISR